MNGSQNAESIPKQSGREFWNHHIEACSKSALTQIEYCRKNNLSRYAFGYWKSKLNKKKNYRPLLPVSVKSEMIPANASVTSGISISFNNRFDIRLEVGFNCDTLSRLIDLLETR